MDLLDALSIGTCQVWKKREFETEQIAKYLHSNSDTALKLFDNFNQQASDFAFLPVVPG
jgi:hypothetical protein